MCNNNNGEGKLVNFIAGVVIGSALGAFAGLLAAPKAGSETRHEILDGVHDTQEKATKLLDDLKNNSEKLLNDTKKIIDEKINLLSESIKAGKKAASESKKEIIESVKPATEE